MLAYKALQDLAPQYLTDLLMPYTSRRNLSSSLSGLLVVPKTRLHSRGDKAASFGILSRPTSGKQMH